MTLPLLRTSHLRPTLVFVYKIAGLGKRYAMPILRQSHLLTTLVFVYTVAGLGRRYTLPPLSQGHLRDRGRGCGGSV